MERAPKAMRLHYYNLISFRQRIVAQASENIKNHDLDCHLWKVKILPPEDHALKLM